LEHQLGAAPSPEMFAEDYLMLFFDSTDVYGGFEGLRFEGSRRKSAANKPG